LTDWTNRFLSHAKSVAQWSKDPSTKVGAVIVRPDRTIASHGFNGMPRGCDDDPSIYADRDLKYKRIVHAEANAIVTAREPLHGYTLYTWPFQPCSTCAGLAIQAGITRVVSLKDDNPRWQKSFACTEQMFREAGVVLQLEETLQAVPS
jgi:dCMP deaminase